MPIPTYTPGYPPDGSSLGQTKATIRNNLDGTFETLGVNHVNNNGQPGSNPAGYHTIVQEVTQTSVNTVTGVNQVFSGIPGTLAVNATTTPSIPSDGDTQLYSLTGTGVLSQLTGGSATANGFSWTGGVLLQWGFVSNPGGSGSVSFPKTFPHNVFNVQLSFQRPSTNVAVNFALSAAPTTSGFSYYSNTSGSTTLFWFAIGN